MIIKKHPYSETFKNMKVGDTYNFDKDLMSGSLTKEIKMSDVKINETVSENGLKVAIFVCCGHVSNPKEVLDEVIDEYISNDKTKYKEFIDSYLDDPWVRIITSDLNSLVFVDFENQKLED